MNSLLGYVLGVETILGHDIHVNIGMNIITILLKSLRPKKPRVFTDKLLKLRQIWGRRKKNFILLCLVVLKTQCPFSFFVLSSNSFYQLF